MTISPLAASPTDCILCFLVDGSIGSPEAKNIGVLLCLTKWSFYLIRKKWCQKENCHLILAQAYNLRGCNPVPRAYKYRGQDFYHSCNRSCFILLHIQKSWLQVCYVKVWFAHHQWQKMGTIKKKKGLPLWQTVFIFASRPMLKAA